MLALELLPLLQWIKSHETVKRIFIVSNEFHYRKEHSM